MVFSGRLSRACQRCRDRRLKCDFGPDSCGQCIRAGVSCSGYRDHRAIRIRDETEAVRMKALSIVASHPGPKSLEISLDTRARDAFFAHYVSGFSKAWDFLNPFYDSTQLPKHLNLCIEAASLAYLSHQFQSEAVLHSARLRYVSALRMMSKALQSHQVATEETTLVSSLLLDLYEKITSNEPPHNETWTSHVNGALSLVQLRGLKHFENPHALQMLVRLSTNLLISCVANETRVPKELIALRAHAEKFIDASDPKWRLSDVMTEYASLRYELRNGHLSIDDSIERCLVIDNKLLTLSQDMPPSWMYKLVYLDNHSDQVLNHQVSYYLDRHTTQTWNIIRLVRIILNDLIIEYCQLFEKMTENQISMTQTAFNNISLLANDICASIPQYTDCTGAARFTLSTLGTPNSDAPKSPSHIHPESRDLDCYALILPLFVCGSSKSSGKVLKPWIIGQLHHIGSHFGIRNAELVAQILEEGTQLNHWAIYSILGSYAFAA